MTNTCLTLERPRLLLLLLVLSVNTACAASFDCAKASTDVEKMICVDPELSSLDSELGKIYAKAKSSLEDSSALIRNQKGWIKWERDRCENTSCLKDTYQDQISELESVIKFDFSSKVKNFHPYPDVWDLHFPILHMERGLGFTVFKKNNNDYSIYFSKQIPSKGNAEYASNFFERSIEVDPASRASAFSRLVHMSADLIPGSTTVQLKNGVNVSMENMDHRIQQWCPQDLNHYYVIEYPDGRRERKSLLYLLERHQHSEINEHCAKAAGRVETALDVKVWVMIGKIIPLDDGGFLLADAESGIVLRFDENFQSRSNLIGKRVFIIDTEQMEKMGAYQFESMDYQRRQDKIFEYLKGL